uniref:HAT C-terminal dimerisation domain-containing protein n=1 Tax=Lactuca sativa TaxID=4236 RepID=A0A9R1X720_LACSA|nr:hypothetical protein LSAT_V11C600299190 [Lactuca sativa]
MKNIVHAATKETIKVIMKDIGDDFFAILVDGSHDVSCKEQMALFLQFMNECGLSPHMIRGKCYDGASNMRGAFNGLETLIMKEVESAHFIHWFAHQLQLALVFVVKNHSDINDFFELISRLLNMIGSSYKRDIQSGIGLNQEVSIKRPGDTRLGSHYGSLVNIKRIYSSICEVLEDIIRYNHKAKARRLLKLLRTFDFIFCLHLMVDILGVTNATLQKKDQNIVNVMHQVRSSKDRLKQIRNEGWEALLNNFSLFCEKSYIKILSMEDPYYDGLSRRKDSNELNNRFNETNTTLLVLMASLCPSKSFQAFNLEALLKMTKFYPNEFPEHDLGTLRANLQKYIVDVHGDEMFNNLKGIGNITKMMVETNKHTIYPMVYLLLKLALILPVATSTVERAFAAMKLINNDLHNKMGDQFMNDCLVSYIEKDVLNGISNDAIKDYFQNMSSRREQL